MEQQRNLTEIGQEILRNARNELYLNLPYLDVALCGLTPAPGSDKTLSLATDGEWMYYDGAYLAERYLRGQNIVNRAYLHMILHCMLRHLAKKKGKVSELWDLACDASVESILDELEYPCLQGARTPARKKFYGECLAEMPVLTAEGIYRHLLRADLGEYEVAQLQRLFLVDDHGLWDPEKKDEQDRNQRQDQQWKDISEKSQTQLGTQPDSRGAGGKAILEQIAVAVRDDVDYRAFLRRFATPREVLGVDGDSFDYIFYTYGLQLYGNMPLIEPTETKEEKRIEDFVIAVDTSMSTSGELVRQFLACTYSILRSTETFTRKVNIRIIQCDDQVRSDTAIHDLSELKRYMDSFQLIGGSSTDFRPVFEHVAQLEQQGAFSRLRGLVYFTDGIGVYPEKRTPYETAFVLLQEPPDFIRIPPWAIRLVLEIPDLERALEGTYDLDFTDEIDLHDMPEF